MLTNYQLIDFFMIFKSNKKKKYVRKKYSGNYIGSIQWNRLYTVADRIISPHFRLRFYVLRHLFFFLFWAKYF